MKASLPNVLTGLRLVLCLVMFVGLFMVEWALRDPGVLPADPAPVLWTIFLSFAVASVTDFFDGYLARRWNVVSTTGAILDPIADKVLVCGALIGLVALGIPWLLIPSGLILFREFAVSALREVLAPKGVKLPVTFLAKTKTTLQLVAIGLIMLFFFWPGLGLPPGLWLGNAQKAAIGLLWLAAAVTVWTGAEYAASARKALKA